MIFVLEYHKFPSRPSVIPVEEPPAKKQKAETEVEQVEATQPTLISSHKTSFHAQFKENSQTKTEGIFSDPFESEEVMVINFFKENMLY